MSDYTCVLFWSAWIFWQYGHDFTEVNKNKHKKFLKFLLGISYLAANWNRSTQSHVGVASPPLVKQWTGYMARCKSSQILGVLWHGVARSLLIISFLPQILLGDWGHGQRKETNLKGYLKQSSGEESAKYRRSIRQLGRDLPRSRGESMASEEERKQWFVCFLSLKTSDSVWR